MRRHLVRKSTKGQVVHLGKDRQEVSARLRKQDRKPHEVRWGRKNPGLGGRGLGLLPVTNLG